MSTDATTPRAIPQPETPLPPPAADSSAFPDDPGVLKQMLIEVLRELRKTQRRADEAENRLDAYLRQRYGPRPEPVNPLQPPLFPEMLEAPAPPTPEEHAPPAEKQNRRGQQKPHGRRRPAKNLRREPRRHELTAAERLCPECGTERQEIGVETTAQYAARAVSSGWA